jgi:hypothetical protein
MVKDSKKALAICCRRKNTEPPNGYPCCSALLYLNAEYSIQVTLSYPRTSPAILQIHSENTSNTYTISTLTDSNVDCRSFGGAICRRWRYHLHRQQISLPILCWFSVRFSFCGDGGGCGGILHLMDILMQQKKSPEGSGRKTFKIWTQ